MFEVAGIDHIVLRTTKLQAMLEFYSGILGCKIERETSPKTGLTQLRAGNALIDLVVVDSDLGKLGGAAPIKTGNNVDHFCLQLKPISEQDIKTYLVSNGVEVGEFDDRFGAQGFGKSVYIKDPEGTVVELKSQIPVKY
jgi:catechol 2,3-dioxygenase-like lactoylglutathione lyase family enzyme